MEQVFYQLPVQAAVQAPAFNVVNPQFSGTAAAEIVNTIEWLVVADS